MTDAPKMSILQEGHVPREVSPADDVNNFAKCNFEGSSMTPQRGGRHRSLWTTLLLAPILLSEDNSQLPGARFHS